MTPSDLLNPERLGVRLDLGMVSPVPVFIASQWARGVRRIGIQRGEEGQWQYVIQETMEHLSDEARLDEQFRYLLGDAEDRKQGES